MLLNKITIDDFKGCRHGEYVFGGKNARISGQNGIGKSTIVDAWTWLWWDKDNQLVSNPNIRPADEVDVMYEPSVVCDIDVDGKTIQVRKSQKKKVSKDGKISLTNNYEINCVPKSERDFKSYFEDLGIELTQMLQLSHPEVFVSGMNEKKSREQMRSTLFKMSSDITDYEVAKKTEGVSELLLLLENYTVEEIQKIQAATIRKIKDEYGAGGEIIDAQIQGKESLRVDIDLAELELQRNSLLDAIKQNEILMDTENAKLEEYNKLSDGVLELKFQLSDMSLKANADLLQKKTEHEHKLTLLSAEIRNIQNQIEKLKLQLKNAKKSYEYNFDVLNKKREEYTAVKNEKMDEESFICPTCGQKLPEEQIEQVREEYESRKRTRLQNIVEAGNDAKSKVEIDKDFQIGATKSVENMENQLAEKKKELAELTTVVFPDEIDVKETEAYKVIELKIKEAESLMKISSDSDEKKKQIRNDIAAIQSELREVEKKISSVAINEKIDQQIEELRLKKLELAQEKVNCEKILYQIDLLNRSKNELLTEEINSHFEMVEWVLFKVLKNGSYEDACIPTYKGKVLGESTNTALSLKMKLDIANSLQRFNGKSYPVFVDGAECFDSNNYKNINVNSQLILLCVSNDKELKIEVI